MLDRADGNLRFEDPDIVIGPGLTRKAFLGSAAGAGALTHSANEPWHSWTLPRCRAGLEFTVTLVFEGEQLRTVHLSNNDPAFGTCWMNYTPEKEIAKQGTHDAWLVSQCHIPPGTYPWGSVWSGLLHARDRLATILIRYPDAA